MITSESTQIITKFIPRLIQESKVPISNIKTDCCTAYTSPKRVDIIISETNSSSSDFEEKIITVIEVKQELDAYLNIFDASNLTVRKEILDLIEKNLANYEKNSSNIDYSNIKEKGWFNALIQGIWKARRLKLNFFGVTNISKIQFYNTYNLAPIQLQRTVATVKNGNIVHLDSTEPLKGLPSYNLLLDLKNCIVPTNSICDYRRLKQDEQNERLSMNEKQFIDFLNRIHNEFYKGSLSGRKKYLGDIILTFLFFKYLEERVQQTKNIARYTSSSIKLWSEWVNEEDLLIANKTEQVGEEIYSTIKRQLELLSNKDDSKDRNGEYRKNYEKEYRDFSTILANINDIPDNEIGYKFIAKIYKELNGINSSTNIKDKNLYLHACNFDVYGAIYEKFKEKDEKEELGQYYTKRHISKILARLTLKPYIDEIKTQINALIDDKKRKGNKVDANEIVQIIEKNYKTLKIIDPSCGTGGLLTECYEYLEEEYKIILTGKNEVIDSILSNDTFTGIDIEEDCVKKAKLNMFFAGDGHSQLYRGSSLEKLIDQRPELSDDCTKNDWNVIISNPPYGKGKEYLFFKKYIDALPYGGRIGIIIPNGILENPSKEKFRIDLIKNIKIETIISLNRFVFAPYAKQKTYMLIGYKRDEQTLRDLNEELIEDISEMITKKLTFDDLDDKIWCYILDFDGYNLSDNRWETDLMVIENDTPQYIHNDTFEVLNKYLKADIIKTNQLDIEGNLLGVKDASGNYKLNKSKFIQINSDVTSKYHYNLLPEYYMRPYCPEYITEEEFTKEAELIWKEIQTVFNHKLE